MPFKPSLIAVLLGVLAAFCIIAALISFPNHDGINTDLAGVVIAPLQALNTPTTQPIFQVGDFQFGEEEAIKLVLIVAILSSLSGLLLCFFAVKAKNFTKLYSVSFLLCVSSLIIGYFNFGFLL